MNPKKNDDATGDDDDNIDEVGETEKNTDEDADDLIDDGIEDGEEIE